MRACRGEVSVGNVIGLIARSCGTKNAPIR
jgi:hypothetical protein